MKRFWGWLTVSAVKKDVQVILHLPLVQRLAHRKARRTVVAVSLSVVLMLTGSTIAHEAKWFNELLGVHQLLVDAVGYFTHAVGAVPAIRYLDPFWSILMGGAETVVEEGGGQL